MSVFDFATCGVSLTPSCATANSTLCHWRWTCGPPFSQCVTTWQELAGVLIGISSIACWLGAQAPQLVVNFKGKRAESLSWLFLFAWFGGDSTNLVGAILSKQTQVQIYTAIYFCCMDVVLFSQWLWYQKFYPRLYKQKGYLEIPDEDPDISITRSSAAPRATPSASGASTGFSSSISLAVQPSRGETTSPLRRKKDIAPPNRLSPGSSHSLTSPADVRPERAAGSVTSVTSPTSPTNSSAGSRTPVLGSLGGGTQVQGLSSRVPRQFRPSTSGKTAGRPPSKDPPQDAQRPPLFRVPGAPTAPRSANAPVGATGTHQMDVAKEESSSRLQAFSPVAFTVMFVLLRAIAPAVSTSLPSSSSSWPSSEGAAFEVSALDLSSNSTVHAAGTSEESMYYIGLALGWVSACFYLVSRVPQLVKNVQRGTTDGLSPIMFTMAVMGNVTYSLGIIFSASTYGEFQEGFSEKQDAQPMRFIWCHLPFIVGSLGTVIFDATTLFQFWFFRRKRLAALQLSGGLLYGGPPSLGNLISAAVHVPVRPDSKANFRTALYGRLGIFMVPSASPRDGGSVSALSEGES